jgi:Na+-transporting NADH:ubiquinone oxidoreductase subunit NqrD
MRLITIIFSGNLRALAINGFGSGIAITTEIKTSFAVRSLRSEFAVNSAFQTSFETGRKPPY